MGKFRDWIQELDLKGKLERPVSTPKAMIKVDGEKIAKEIRQGMDKGFKELRELKGMDHDGEPGDTRYNEPKKKPQASDEMVEETINNTEIYRRAKELILNAQKEQVAYGLDKYPEPLNPDSWTIKETLEHKLSESIDRLHYDVMLILQLEKLLEETPDEDDHDENSYHASSVRAMYGQPHHWMVGDEKVPVGLDIDEGDYREKKKEDPGEILKRVNDYRETLGYEPIILEAAEDDYEIYGVHPKDPRLDRMTVNEIREENEKLGGNPFPKGSINHIRVKEGFKPLEDVKPKYEELTDHKVVPVYGGDWNNPLKYHHFNRGPAVFHATTRIDGRDIVLTIHATDKQRADLIKGCVKGHLYYTRHVITGQPGGNGDLFTYHATYHEKDGLTMVVKVHDKKYLEEFEKAVESGLIDANMKARAVFK